MEINRIIAEIDAQISKLQQARQLLAGTSVSASPKPGRGRPKGSKNATGTKRKRVLSADARKRIADAQRRRWAERRKQTEKK